MSPLNNLCAVSFSDFITDFTSPLLLRAFSVGALVSLCSAMLGVILVLKRYALIGHGLGEVGFAAAALAALIGLEDYNLAFSIPLVCLTSILIMRLDRKSGLGGDVLIGIFSTSALALGVIASSFVKGKNVVFNFMFGSLLGLTRGYVIAACVLSLTVIAVFVLLYNRLFAVTYDETYMRATGQSADIYQFIVSLLTSVTVVLGMKVMGAMMISSFIIFPALTARRFARSFRGLIIAAAVDALISFIAGMIVSYYANLAPGACVVAASLVLMLLAFTCTARAKSK